jgi:hypothetical protein
VSTPTLRRTAEGGHRGAEPSPLPRILPPPSLGRPLLLSLGLIALCGLVPLLAYAVTSPGTDTVAGWWTAGLVLLWSGAHLAWLVARGEPRLLEFITWLFAYVFLGLAAFIQMRAGAFPTTTPGLPTEYAERAGLVVLVGLAGVEAGLWVARRRWGSRVPRHRVGSSTISEARAVLLGVAGLVLAAYYVSRVGLPTLFTSRTELLRVRGGIWPDRTTAAIVLVSAYVPLLVAVHALVRIRRTARATGRTPRWPGALAAVCLAVLLTVVNPVTSPRYVVGTVLLSLLFLAGGFRTPRRTRVWLVALIVALVVVFPYSDVFRTSSGGGNQQALTANLTLNGDYDAFAQVVNTVAYVDREGVTDGRQALGVALFWVPRSVWPDKPIDTGVLLAEANDYDFTNLSAPIWAEMYINGGWLVVVLGSLALGVGVGAAGARTWVHDRDSSVAAIALGLVSFYLLIVLRGSLLQSMAHLSVLVACTLFLRSRGGERSRSSGRAPRVRA